MSLNFPSSPSIGQIYTDSVSGFSYEWNGTVWISFTGASSSQIKLLDDISGSFNNVTQTFALTSNTVSVTPITPQSLIINLGGVIQDPTDDYSISGSNIVFSTPPTSGLSFSGISLGPAVPISKILDGAVTDGSLTVAGILSTSNLFVTGISTLGNTVVGGATTQLFVTGNARVTGILTIGTSSLTLDGVNDRITVGSGLTITTSGITIGPTTINSSGSLSVTAGTITTLDTTNLTGTAGTITTFNSTVGSITNLTSTNVNASGIVTATTFVGALTGTASNVTTNANLTGDVTSVGNATSIATGVIVNADINASAAIVDTKLATIATAGKVSNSATTATNANTASAIVARDASGNFSAGTITATTFVGALTGTATSTTNIPNLTGAITSVNTTTSLGSFTSANLATALTDETGSGAAVFATSPTLVTPVLGSATATSIVVSSGSTFTNGPVFIGAATSTGTASQRLQVTGGAYVSGVGVATGSIGVGITNPQGTIDIRTAPQWSAFNYGANLVIGGTRNNGIGILDSSNSNPWAIINAAGSLLFAQMPALGNTASVATEAARITTNRNLLIGALTETGTASQPLQVTGGAYVSGNLGVGVTNPTAYKVHVAGDIKSTQALHFGTGGTYEAGTIYSDANWGTIIRANTTSPAIADFMIANSADVQRFRIDTSGNVIIPGNTTATGTASQPLQVTGGAYFSGNVGIGTSAPSTLLHVAGNVRVGANNTDDAELQIGAGAPGNRNAYIDLVGDTTYTDYGLRVWRTNGGLNANSLITHRGTGNLTLSTDDVAPIAFNINLSERARIDTSGRLLVGTSSAYTVEGFNRHSYFCPTAGDTNNQIVVSAVGAAGFPSIYFTKTRGASPATQTIVQDNDTLGRIRFFGSDGVDYDNSAAGIDCFVDGTPGANDMPGRLVFSTTADGGSSPTERMRITSDGRVFIGHALNVGGTGMIAPLGYVGRSGTGGSFVNVFNIAWTGTVANLWIDTTNIGTIQTISDYRIKKNIQTQTAPAIERIKQLRPVTYELKDYGDIFKADGIVREGFIAHEVQEVIPSGAEGEKDEENRIQNLRTDAIVAVLTKALQEAIAKIEVLESKVAALEGS